MKNLIKIINPIADGPAVQRIRMWLPVGIPAVLGRGVAATMYSNRCGEHYIPCIEIVTRMRMPVRQELPPGQWFDMTQYCGALMMPRAASFDDAGYLTKYFVEYALVDRAKLFFLKTGGAHE